MTDSQRKAMRNTYMAELELNDLDAKQCIYMDKLFQKL